MPVQIQIRNGTAAQWTAANPTLAAGEVGIESDTKKQKFGDGTTAWNSLGYAGSTGTVSSVGMSVPAFLSVTGSPVTSSGTLAVTLSGTALPVANGGTGQTTTTAAFDALAPSQTSNSGKYLTTNGTTTSWATVSGGGSPGGATTQIQYNNSGVFAGSASLIWDNPNSALGVGGTPAASKGSLQVGTIGYTDTGVIAGFASSTAGYNQIVLQNTNNGSTSSTNFNVSNDSGTTSTNFGEFGINSSTFSGTGSFNTAGYTYLASASTDLAIGTYGSNKIHFVVNSGATDAAVFDTSGNFGIGQATPGSKLDVKGTLRLSGSSSGYVGLAPAAAAGSTTYTLPSADGTNGQALVTNGTATLSWATVSGGGGTVASGCIYLNNLTISASYTIATSQGAHSVGPITIGTGAVLTVASGSRYVIA
jgi:hypothetical protein